MTCHGLLKTFLVKAKLEPRISDKLKTLERRSKTELFIRVIQLETPDYFPEAVKNI